MNENDDRRFAFDLRIDNESLYGTVVVLQSDILVVARGCIKTRLCPVLGEAGDGSKWKQQTGGEPDKAGNRNCHAEESSHNPQRFARA